MEEEVVIDNLSGTITWPSPDPSSKLAVLILPGSGAVDQNGNFPEATNNCLKFLAEGLGALGFISLRIDKRGIRSSREALLGEEDLSINTYVDDALLWLNFLETKTGTQKIVIAGHSEGALIATMVAQKKNLSGLVLLAGAGFPALKIIERQLSMSGLSASLIQQAHNIGGSLLRGEWVADIPSSLFSIFRPSVQPYLMSWLPLDPAQEIAKTNIPALIIQGTHDLQITVADAERLADSRSHTQLSLIAGMNHILKMAPMEREENLKTYMQSDLQLAPALLPIIADFLVEIVSFRR